jgi:hypothetical protein
MGKVQTLEKAKKEGRQCRNHSGLSGMLARTRPRVRSLQFPTARKRHDGRAALGPAVDIAADVTSVAARTWRMFG